MVKGKLVFLGEVPEYTPWLKEMLLFILGSWAVLTQV
jgi:hypothetical protein